MRLHRNLVFTVIDSVKSIFNEGEYADKAVEKALKRDARWGARDRKFVAETIYEMVRWKRLYNEIAGTKEHYTTENVWKNFSVWAILKGIKLPEWNQLQGVPERRIKGKFDELQKVRVFKESIPDWLDEMGVKELGEAQWTKEIHQLNEQADVILRANTLKTTKANLQKKLMDEGIE
ncbi:MAG TPA: RNA methyltransferase, partial [Lutibacter sp.]|nr:RNA methyltransferase [Lutibacter sp.]